MVSSSVTGHTGPTSSSVESKGSGLSLQPFQFAQFDPSVFPYEKNCGSQALSEYLLKAVYMGL